MKAESPLAFWKAPDNPTFTAPNNRSFFKTGKCSRILEADVFRVRISIVNLCA